MTRILILTGAPGVGKTTMMLKTVDELKTKGVRVGGMVTREVREGNVRIGFKILDLSSNKQGWLAHINKQGISQVGKYYVNLKGLDNIGSAAIANALENCDVIAIDEIGPMELFSQEFKRVVTQAIEGKKLILTVVHGKAKDQLVTHVKRRVDAEIFNVTFSNRDQMTNELVRKVSEMI